MDLGFYFKLFLRRLPYFMVFVVLGTAGGVALATMLPPSYSSRAVLVVESEQIPGDLAASTVQTETTEALSIIRQRVLTRANLLEMANDFEIYGPPSGDRRRSMTPDEVVEDLRRRIQIRTTGGTSRRGPTEATIVTVGFSADRAQLAANVANEVVTQILELNVSLRRDVAGETLEFFSREVDRLDRDLATREREILAFQEENLDALPDSLEFRRSQQAAAQERLQQYNRGETTLRDRRDRLVDLFESTGEVFASQDQPRSENEIQLDEMREALALARATLAPGNPRLGVLEAQVEAMSRLVAEEQAEAAGTAAGQDPQLTAFEIQLADIDGQLAFIEEQKAFLTEQMAELQASIEATPANSIKLESMQRDYDAVRTQYEQAVSNRAAAETGDVIENLSKGQRITVIEQAVAPSSPTSPNRPVIAAGGIAGGIALGAAFVFLLELLNSSIRRPVDLQNKLGITPFGTLPLIRTPWQERRRRATILVTLLAIAAAVPAGLWYIQSEVMPLDLLLERVLDRVGIAGLAAGPFFPQPT